MTTASESTLVGVCQSYFAAWNGREEGAIDDVLADSFTWVDPLLPEPLDTLDGAHDFMTNSWAGMPDFRMELIGDALVDEGAGRVAQAWRMLGTHEGEFPPGVEATGKQVDVIGIDVFAVDDDGRITEIRACWDSMAVMRQLGLA